MKIKDFFNNSTWQRIVQIFLYVYVAECTFGGSGRWLEIGPLSIRMIIFAICFIATLPAVFQNIRKLTKNLQVISTVGFGVYLLICAVIGFQSGNSFHFIWADLTTFMSLALLPGFMATMSNSISIQRAIDVVFWCATGIACFTILTHLLIAFVGADFTNFASNFLNSTSIGALAPLQTGIHRIYMRNQIFLQVAIVYGIWKIGKSTTTAMRIVLCVAEGILLSSCILSYTRGFWIGLATSVLLLFLLGIKYWKKFIKSAVCMLMMFSVFVGVSWVSYQSPAVCIEIVNRFNPNLIPGYTSGWDDIFENPDHVDDPFSDAPPTDNDQAAVNLREQTLLLLNERIAAHPLFGNGLGENLDEIRDDGRTEYMYKDLLMKTGILGICLFCVTFFGFIIIQIRQSLLRRKQGLPSPNWDDAEIRNRIMIAAYLGVAVTSFFNPFLNNPMGIMLLILTATAVYEEKSQVRYTP